MSRRALHLLLLLPLFACGDSGVAGEVSGSSGGSSGGAGPSTGPGPTTGDGTTGGPTTSSSTGGDAMTSTTGTTGDATGTTAEAATTEGVEASGETSSGEASTGTTAAETTAADTSTGDASTGSSTGDDETTKGEIGTPMPSAQCVEGDLTTFVADMSFAHELHIVGVYQATGNALTVEVNRADVPLTLVLSSYEPVAFTLVLGPGVLLEEVILNGYNVHTVAGQGDALVTDRSGIGNYLSACGYFWPDNDQGCMTQLLAQGAEALTGLELTSFAGCYEAASFSLE
jgi:hypothetical protein